MGAPRGTQPAQGARGGRGPQDHGSLDAVFGFSNTERFTPAVQREIAPAQL